MDDYPELDPLTKLAIRHGTDKWGPHWYTPIYHELFGSRRERPLRLLEIGVGGYEYRKVGGASLSMWADYFPHGHIVGIDIAEKDVSLDQRIIILRGSQTDPAFLATVVAEHGPFDIIIDDGSHVPRDVLASFYALFPKMTDNGLYVIEDIQTAFWPEFGGSAVDGGETLIFAQLILQGLNYKEIGVATPTWQPPTFAPSVRSFRAYHNLFVIEKGDNSEPSNFRYDGADIHVASMIASIEREQASMPTAGGHTNLARVYNLSGQARQTLDIVDRALTRWPNHVPLLMMGMFAARDCGETSKQHHYAKRAMEIDPKDQAWQQFADSSDLKK